MKNLKNHRVQITRDEDGIFIATVPELPGCVSDGPTDEAARRNIQVAIALWLEAEKAKI